MHIPGATNASVANTGCPSANTSLADTTLMHAQRLAIPDVICFTPKVFGDDRGFFYESFNQRVFEQALGRAVPHFVQDNHSRSAKGVLRGLHYQIQQPQGKLVRVTQGEVFDVAVDIRKSSPTFGNWVGEILSAQNNKQIWVPPGFAHGFLVLSDTAEFLYKTTDFWAPQFERCIAWNDPAIGIKWPLQDIIPALSGKDAQGKLLAQAECFI
jgi:dTDP-4-dehydrorhamnose 3,5-epimerase